MRKPVFGDSDQISLKLACAATETSYRLETLCIVTTYIILSKQQIIKALIRLRGCAYCSHMVKTGFLMTWLNFWQFSLTTASNASQQHRMPHNHTECLTTLNASQQHWTPHNSTECLTTALNASQQQWVYIPHVSLKLWPLYKAPPTTTAAVWSFSSMYSDMSVKFVIRQKNFPAIFARSVQVASPWSPSDFAYSLWCWCVHMTLNGKKITIY